MADYPSNLPEYVPPPEKEKPAEKDKPKSLYDTLKDRGRDVLDKVDKMTQTGGRGGNAGRRQ